MLAAVPGLEKIWVNMNDVLRKTFVNQVALQVLVCSVVGLIAIGVAPSVAWASASLKGNEAVASKTQRIIVHIEIHYAFFLSLYHIRLFLHHDSPVHDMAWEVTEKWEGACVFWGKCQLRLSLGWNQDTMKPLSIELRRPIPFDLNVGFLQ